MPESRSPSPSARSSVCLQAGADGPALSTVERPADKSGMHPLRRNALVMPIALALSLGAAAPAAIAAPEVLIADEGAAMSVATDPGSGRSIVISGRAARGSRDHPALELVATALDRGGRPSAAGSQIGEGMTPDMTFVGGPQVSVAVDVRRGRHLVAWSAHREGMGRTPCAAPPTPPWLTSPDDPPCAIVDREIHVRLVDRLGRPVGPQRQVTSIGPPASGEFSSAGAVVAYDARADTFLLVFAGRVSGDGARAALFSQRLRHDGRPLGDARRLALRRETLSVAPLAQLAADPRGGHLLVYTWGATAAQRRLYARRLTSDGRPAGRTTALTAAGAGSVQLAFDRRRRRALAVYSPAAPGAEQGVRARLLTTGGRPLAGPVDLPYRLGTGPVAVASDSQSGGWIYAFVRQRDRLVRQLLVQRARPTGRPAGTARLVSQPDHRASEPAVAAAPGGTLLAAWSETEIACDSGGGCRTGAASVHARLIRP